MGSSIIVATLGFDERHVVRSMLRLGFGNVIGVKLLVPSGGLEERTKRAIEDIRKLASTAGVEELETIEVPVESFAKAVGVIRKVIVDSLKRAESVTLSLGGGLRALIVESLIASLLLPPRDRSRVRVFVDLETGRGFIEFTPMLPVSIELSEVESRLLREVFSYSRNVTLSEASNKLRDIPKSTLWKELEKLVAKGLLLKEGSLYKLTQLGELILETLVH